MKSTITEIYNSVDTLNNILDTVRDSVNRKISERSPEGYEMGNKKQLKRHGV